MTFPPDDLPSIEDVEASLCRDSFADFVRSAWAHVPHLTSVELVWNWHMDAVCRHLEAVARGEVRYLLINMPPRSSKTELVGVFFLPWVWTWRPGWKAIFASLSKDGADETSVFCRTLVESEWYQDRFVKGRGPVVEGRPTDAWEMRSDKNRMGDFANTVGGGRFSTSVGGTVIGKGAHCIIGDDLQDDKGTPAEWRKTQAYWSGTLSSRADDPATVAKICVQQRLGKGDLSESLLASGLFTHLCLPMQFGEGPANSNVSLVDGREFWRDPRAVRGELLNPRCYPPDLAEKTYVTEAQTYALGCGPVKYKAQYNQNPANDEGGEIRRTYWRFYRHPKHEGTHRPEGCVTADTHPAVALPAKLAKILSADTAVKENQTADYSVVGALRHVDTRVFVWDLERERTEIPGLIRMFKRVSARNPDASQKYIEDKSSGQQLLQLLKRGGEVDGVRFEVEHGLVAVNPGSASKVERTRLHLLPRVEAGDVYLPEGAPWLDEFVAEHAQFPHGEHDDQIDMLAQGLSKLAVSTGLERMRAMSKW